MEYSEYSEYLSLVLAYQFARRYGLNQAAAIRRCARKLRDKTKNDAIYQLCVKALKQGSDAHLVGSIRESSKGLEGESLNDLKSAKVRLAK